MVYNSNFLQLEAVYYNLKMLLNRTTVGACTLHVPIFDVSICLKKVWISSYVLRNEH